MNEPWATTQARLKKWQRETPTAWNLRRALSDSEHFTFIAKSAARRAANRPEHVSWQDWWAFYLERMTEKQAITLLLEVWNKDVWAHMQHEIRAQTHDILADMAERSRVSQELRAPLSLLGSPALALLGHHAPAQTPSPSSSQASAPADDSEPQSGA